MRCLKKSTACYMKKLLLSTLILWAFTAHAQLLSWSPDFIQESSTPVVITMDASFGNKGLLNYTPTSDVYVHIGVLTNKSPVNWTHVPFNWGTTPAAAQCVYLGNNKWKFTITGGLRNFFGLTDAAETISEIGILFRNGAGSVVQRNADQSDMFIPVYDNGVYTRIDEPFRQPLLNPVPEPINKRVGDALTITAKASKAGALSIFFNGTELGSTSSTTLTKTTSIAGPGDQVIVSRSVVGTVTKSDTLKFTVAESSPIVALPANVVDGINYEAGDTSATLVLYAPHKSSIFVLGDFNNWAASTRYLMNLTPDSTRFWIRLTGLTPGVEYAYQYLIDGTLKLADYNTEKVLDPDNDKYISSATYPNLKAYPAGKTTGIVGVLQTKKPAYTWQVNNFTRPAKSNLVIYELLVRDFTAAGNFQTLKDTLNYLQQLGVNAIEVMPFNEFEGNNSWGYNPDFYFAPDKAYGTETAVKQFIDECHKRGIAVIMDMVLNHSFGQSPMVQMYFDKALNVPAANSPWFNQYAKHAYNVGYDFNHQSTATQDFTNRVINFWLKNYKIDGMRWDLAKGFTQKQTCDATGGNCDVSAWGAYDQTRVDIWKKYYADMQAASANSYCILEMFADDSEQKVEAAGGMMLWGNMNYNFNQNTMGYSDGADITYGLYTAHSFAQPNLVTYQESHDEERLMFKNEQYGNSSGTYNVKDIPTGLSRNGMAAAFWAMMPGPKMMWQFGELGYDYSINRCEDGSINDNCRTNPKPVVWNYLQDAGRKALHDVYASLIKLRTYPAYASTFTNGTVVGNLAGLTKSMSVSGNSLKVEVIGNFDVTVKTITAIFPSTGTWYSFLTNKTISVTSTSYTVTLQPGEYYVYTDRNVKDVVLPVNWLSFTAQKTNDNKVLVTWSTGNEVNNDHFEVERSNTPTNFRGIGVIKSSASTTNIHTYNFTDVAPLNGVSYYRIKQIDKDGAVTYSSIQKVDMNALVKLWKLYPNPAKNNTGLLAAKGMNNVQVSITDMRGKMLMTKTVGEVAEGQYINLPLMLAKGMYMVKITSGEQVNVERLVVQ